MQSFTNFLTEDKNRFIRKNKNLTNDQKKEVSNFFKVNRQAENKVDWNKSKTMTYDDFADIMIQTKSGRKTIIKHKAIKGLKEGMDYVHVRMPSKEYLAYIPLDFETAQKFNTRELGVCSGPWCIGHSGEPYHWNDEVIIKQQVPVYVVNRFSKWVVMIQEENRKFEVWTVENLPRQVKQGIPDFSIRKNLLNPKQKAMYDEIREDFYDEETEPEEIDVDDAIIDYDNLVVDIENSESNRESAKDNAREEFYIEAHRIKEDTKDEYENKYNEAYDIYNDLQILFDEGEELQQNFEDTDDAGETSYFDGEYLNYNEIQDTLDDIEKKKDAALENAENIEEIKDSIDDVEEYDMYDNDDINWSEYPPNEDDIYNDLDFEIPSIGDRKYSDYIDIAEQHMGFSIRYSGSDVDKDIVEYSYGNSRWRTAEEVLSNHELYHPDYVNDR